MTKVSYDVPVVRQEQNPICWVACAAMILSHERQQSVTVGELLGFEPSSASIANPAGGSWQTMYDMLEGWGITSTGPQMSPAPAFITQTLQADGPFILTHFTKTLAPSSTSPGTHAVVVTGIDTGAGECYFNNPWGAMGDKAPINTILQSMERLWEMNLRSVAYCD